jgi:hypothetical protein
LKSYKNIKTFCAHLEIFVCLYLKRIFKLFLHNIIYNVQKPKYNNNKELNNSRNIKGNNEANISNVNNAYCSLFDSINSKQDKEFNTIIDNQNKHFKENNSFTPITKRSIIENMKQMTKEKINNINKRNNNLLNQQENDKKRYSKDCSQKSIYIPKKKISKSKLDGINKVKTASILNNNKNHDLKSFPIKEMNINLKKINVCRLNELNKIYLNQNLYNCNNIYSNFNYIFTEAPPIIKINNNYLTNYTRNKSNNIHSINIDSSNINIINDEYKLKKIKSAKNIIYAKPEEKNTEKIIKEIRIKNKISPLKKGEEINKSFRNKKGELMTLNNSFNKGRNMNDILKLKKKICIQLIIIEM